MLKNPFRKGKKIYSIIHLKCPCCHEGNLFLHKNPYRLKMLDKMPARCEVCGERFEREVGFYYGAMMISHASTTILAFTTHLIVFHFCGWYIPPHLIAITSVLLIAFPVVFRTSRAIWLNIFVKYKELNHKKNRISD